MEGVSLAEITYKAAESADQDHIARLYRLILLYTLRKINSVVSDLRIWTENIVQVTI